VNRREKLKTTNQILMKTNPNPSRGKPASKTMQWFTVLLMLPLLAAPVACRTKAKAKDQGFFTSGSRDADQRASQRMAKAEQLSGSGEGTGEKGAKKAVKRPEGAPASGGGTNRGASVEGKLSLYDRLGGTDGLKRIVDDFTPRLLQDPRVNWQRNSTKRGGVFSRGGSSQTWTNNAQNVALLKTHIVEFMALATGGPAKYTGKDMKSVHGGMHITNPEFDAAIGDVKASLDNLQIPNKEQKELLAIIESTRPEIVTVR
jgi:hemoglobin